jgi:catechol 2,3-dioxygenase-like lactoylglutathione lyase family enzyme
MATAEQVATVRQLWPLLSVGDIDRSVDFYQNTLGFTIVGRAEAAGRLFWCRLESGGASIMLQQAEEEDGSAEGRGRGVAFYFVCDDVEQLHTEFSSRGIKLDPIAVAEYGMKQLFVPEPDGYSVCFESPTDKWAG